MGNPNRKIKEEKMKSKQRKLLPFAIFLLTIAIIVGIVVGVFQLKKMTIVGTSYCTKEEVTKMLQNDQFSNNSLYVYLKYKLNRGEMLPCLESVDISLVSPWEMKVKVTEKSPVGYLKKGKKKVYFDSRGTVIYVSKTILDGVPLVEGLKPKNVELYQPLECGSVKIFESILDATLFLKEAELEFHKIVYDNGYVYIYFDRIRVNLGSEVTEDKISQIKPIMEKLGKKKGTLHLENYSKIGDSIPFKEEDISKKS